MKKLLLIAVVFLASCSDINHVERPDDFYGDEKMVDIMTDLYLMEASMTANRTTFTGLEMLPHDFIYEKYETDSVVFAQNLNYYTDRNNKYKGIMEQVQLKLEVIKDTVAVRQRKYTEALDKIVLENDSLSKPMPLDLDN